MANTYECRGSENSGSSGIAFGALGEKLTRCFGTVTVFGLNCEVKFLLETAFVRTGYTKLSF